MILLINVNQNQLKKGQSTHISFKNIPKNKTITQIVFWDNTFAYGTAKLFKICKEKCELINIYTDTEIGLNPSKRKQMLKEKDTEATFINWDYPVYFDKQIRLNTERVKSFRIATKEEEKQLRNELRKCKKK